MYYPRNIETDPSWTDQDGIKIYTISVDNKAVAREPYIARLNEVKANKAIDWPTVPAFVIFHNGESLRYLVLCWWGNDNELFTSVSVQTENGWIEDPSRFSFCLWDLEVFWAERNLFIELIYCEKPNIDEYRTKRLSSALKT